MGFATMGFAKMGAAQGRRLLWNGVNGSKLEATTKLVVTPFNPPMRPTSMDAAARPFQALGALRSTSDFEEIRERGLYYVDKTKPVLDLVNDRKHNKHFFLWRPRRFGKTLVVSVLQHLFLGRKALFTGLYAETNWDWSKKSPVLRFDFSGSNERRFEYELHAMIRCCSEDWSFQSKNKEPTISAALVELVTHLDDSYGPCVVLVDEYDKPVVDVFGLFGKPEEIAPVARRNVGILREFFETINSLGDKIRFSFVTGSSRLTKGSLFSGDNTRKDISFEPAFDTICGFTEDELEPFLAAQSKLNLGELKHMYHGYQFGGSSWLYNPFAIVNAFADGKIGCYWAQSGSLDSFISKVSNPREFFDILHTLDENQGSILIDKSEVHKDFSLDVLLQQQVPLVHLLFQAGYLSLRVENNEIWSLRFPNEEVKTASGTVPTLFWLTIPKKHRFSRVISTAVGTKHLGNLYEATCKLLASVPVPVSADATYYKSILQVAFQAAVEVKPLVECRDSQSLCLVLLSESCRIMIELKLIDPTNQTKEQVQQDAIAALEQARRASTDGPATDVIAGWLVNKQTGTLVNLDEYGKECNQFETLSAETLSAETLSAETLSAGNE